MSGQEYIKNDSDGKRPSSALEKKFIKLLMKMGPTASAEMCARALAAMTDENGSSNFIIEVTHEDELFVVSVNKAEGLVNDSGGKQPSSAPAPSDIPISLDAALSALILSRCDNGIVFYSDLIKIFKDDFDCHDLSVVRNAWDSLVDSGAIGSGPYGMAMNGKRIREILGSSLRQSPVVCKNNVPVFDKLEHVEITFKDEERKELSEQEKTIVQILSEMNAIDAFTLAGRILVVFSDDLNATDTTLDISAGEKSYSISIKREESP